MYVVMIDTAGKQRFIFSSGKRQEIVGASELIARVDGLWAEQALSEMFPGFAEDTWRIETHDAELLVAGAGRLTVLVRERDAGRRLVKVLTCRALKEAPGLDVCGVVVAYEPGSLAARIGEARTELAAVREARPGPQSRFLRLPVVEDCASSGLPAVMIRPEGRDEPPQPRSAAARGKLAVYQPAREWSVKNPDADRPGTGGSALDRLAELAGTGREGMRRIVDELGLRADWVAVVHADGNGLGEIFRRLDESSMGDGDRAYADALRDFSAGVDRCGKEAFAEALRRTSEELGERPLPVLPLVLGGDDLTVVCEGEVALPFTRHYLEAFEEATATDPALSPMLEACGRDRLGAGAGVAIVKRNYPFHFAYELAEKLTEVEAKGVEKDERGERVKDWGSALAFVVLFESAAPDLERIRASVTLSGGSGGSASPYLVGEGSGDDRARGRRWEDLERRVTALTRSDPGSKEPLIPRGAAHDLREGVCLGAEVAEARFELLLRRFGEDLERRSALLELTEEGRLLWPDHQEKTVTGLLDAMAALPFLKVKEGAE
ncbi:Cas10/Cmr2 second palm domain-containing protein [Streptosporangium sp. NPDC087985]|uniref:Cas10/Cmr2 second palm domain-containing protein n=1 Tax=Streptosporangium sp. NPDC087985 TaxID=3366196 RepID=UPI0037FF5E3B